MFSFARFSRRRLSFCAKAQSRLRPPWRLMSEAHATDTRPVRASEQLDWAALDRFARAQLANVLGAQFDATAPLMVEQFPGGHSNLTYLLRFGAHEFVMRRRPRSEEHTSQLQSPAY